jgi:hypothetical protein
MGFLFGSTKTPAPIEPPSPPTVDEAARSRDLADVGRRRRGRLANIFAGKSDKDSTTGAAKILTGG